MNQDDKLSLIKDILLTDEREFVEKISGKIEAIESLLNTPDKLSKKINPIIEHQLNDFTKSVPQTLGPAITEALKEEIKNSRDGVVEALYPIMGQMIKRYVQHEIKVLSEQINRRIDNTFSIKGIKRKLTAIFTGKKPAQQLLEEQFEPIVEQVMVIEKGSGLVFSEYSKTDTIDQDMVAGMLTAIKSFAEDAFQKGGQSLQNIEYDLFNIHLQNFSTYYIAVVTSGNYTTAFKDKLEDRLLHFAKHIVNKTDLKSQESFTKKLNQYFANEAP